MSIRGARAPVQVVCGREDSTLRNVAGGGWGKCESAKVRKWEMLGVSRARERLKPPHRKRKAPQTARGFNCMTRLVARAVADAQVPETPHTAGPPSPRRRTL